VENFNEYINPGFLKYRKSFSPDYVAGKFLSKKNRSFFQKEFYLVEWADSGSTFTCVKGIEYIDCLGGYGIYK
jgi:putrescine aminotransferase